MYANIIMLYIKHKFNQHTKVLLVTDIYDYVIGIFMYKLYNGLMSSIFQYMFVKI